MELVPQFDARKSFYGKAIVETLGECDVLFSYGQNVACVAKGNEPRVYGKWDCSQTTIRHVAEFILQHNYPVSDGICTKREYIAEHYYHGEP